MTRVSVYKDVEVEVDVELSDFDDDDLLEECRSRGITPGITQGENEQRLLDIAQALQLNRSEDAMRLLEDLVYDCTGRIVVLH